ncbi:hypothetical protein [Aliikangiella sp. IMCC44359]|uniref:hypothetical protein n=1 Tax=Aliikangiella sp. IMCC44359 TaxID=3459125 RepID=UPI00403AA825
MKLIKYIFTGLGLIVSFSNLCLAQNKPKLTMSYWPDPVIYGENHTLRWHAENTDSCQNSAGSPIAVSGSWQTVTNLVGEGSSTITCNGPEGSITKTAIYKILPDLSSPPPSLSITYLHPVLEFGDTQTVYWQSTNTISCRNSSGSSITTNGQWSSKVNFLGQGSSTITCFGAGGEITITENYNVAPISDSPVYKAKIDYLLTNNMLYSFPKEHVINGTSFADSGLMYHRWPVIDGIMDFYSVYNDDNYIQLAIDIATAYIDSGVLNDGYLTWYSSVGSYNNINHDHVEWRAAAAIAKIIFEIYENDLVDSYPQDVQFLSDFLEEHVWKKWNSVVNSDMKTSKVTHFIARVGQIALALYQHTKKSVYLNYINYKGLELKNSLELVNIPDNQQGTYNLYCKTPPADCGITNTIDISHASDTISFMVDMYIAGYIFDLKDMQRLANIIKYKTWNQNITTPQFYDNVNGTGNISNIGKYQGGWVKLGQFDDDVLNIYRSWLSSSTNLIDAGESPYNIQIWGNMLKILSINK